MPASTATPVAGADRITIAVTAVDKRTQFLDRVSTKRNGYGMEGARIVATNDVAQLVRGAVERGLTEQGFAIGDGGPEVAIELQNFYNDFRVGVMSGSAVAEVAFTLRVRDAAGTQLYSKFYDGTKKVENLMLASGNNARDSLQQALADAVRQVSEDKALQQALLSTATKPAARRNS